MQTINIVKLYQLSFLLLVITLFACSSTYECITWHNIEFCIDSRADIVVKNDMISINDERDGLPFVADIEFRKFETLAERQIYIDGRTNNAKGTSVTNHVKGMYSFTDIRNSTTVVDGSHSNAIIGGITFSKLDNNELISIEYRGINENKVERYINKLVE